MGKFRYRAYLDGLRGVSVAMVVLFHSEIKVFREGFLGVDVFFVLSGYLITSIILREIKTIGSVDIFRFYARRARRILPGATFCLLCVSLFEALFLPAMIANTHTNCILASSTYWANICFIFESEDYWARESTTSPVKHYWSLSIEEQFYLVYPFTVLVIVKLCACLPFLWRFCVVGSGTDKDSFAYHGLTEKDDDISIDPIENEFNNEVEEINEISNELELKEVKEQEEEEEEEGGEPARNVIVEATEILPQTKDPNEELVVVVDDSRQVDDVDNIRDRIDTEKETTSRISSGEKRNYRPHTRVFIMGVLIVVVTCSLLWSLYLYSVGDITNSHMNSFARCYQLGFGCILAILLDLKMDSTRFWIPRCFYGVIALFSFAGMLFMMLYPVIPIFTMRVYPAISGVFMTAFVIVFIFCIESENLVGQSRLQRLSNGEEEEVYESKIWARRILRIPVLVFLGKWSYSIYLYHFPLIVFGDLFAIYPKSYAERFLDKLVRVTYISLLSVFFGVVSYYLVERVFMKIRIDSYWRKRILASCGIIIPLITLTIVFFLLKIPSDVPDFKFDDIDIEVPVIHHNVTFVEEEEEDNEEDKEKEIQKTIYAERFYVYGDSLVMSQKQMWDEIIKSTGMTGAVLTGPGAPSFEIDYVENPKLTYFRNRNYQPMYQLPVAIQNFKPTVIFLMNHVLMGSWVFDSWYYPDTWPKDKDLTFVEDLVYKFYTRFLQVRIDPGMSEDTQIVQFLPTMVNFGDKWATPPTRINVNECLFAIGETEQGVGDGKRCDFKGVHVKTYPYVKKALERVSLERKDNYTLIDLNEFVCPDGICPAKVGDYSAWMDYMHLSIPFWILKASDFLQLLADDYNIYFEKRPVDEEHVE